MKSILRYFKGVAVEMKRVRWPKFDELLRYTVTVVSFIIFFGAFFYLVTLLMAGIKYVASLI